MQKQQSGKSTLKFLDLKVTGVDSDSRGKREFTWQL